MLPKKARQITSDIAKPIAQPKRSPAETEKTQPAVWLTMDAIPSENATPNLSNLVIESIIRSAITNRVVTGDIFAQPAPRKPEESLTSTTFTTQLTGPYISLTQTLAQMHRKNPTLSLDALSIKRSEAPAIVEAQVRWSLFYRRRLPEAEL